MEWKIKKGAGNVLKRWMLYHNDVSICEIRMFIKGEYVLPEQLFPRNELLLPQIAKDLKTAKKMCEKWVVNFCKSIIKPND